MVGLKKGQYFVSCVNLINKESVEALREGLSHIQKLDKEGLKRLYKEILRGKVPEGSKGASVNLLILQNV